MNLTDPHFRRLGLTALTVLVVAACSGGTSTPGTADGTSAPASGVTADAIPGAATSAAAGGPVLPVPGNPITNTATAEGLKITQVLVENNR